MFLDFSNAFNTLPRQGLLDKISGASPPDLVYLNFAKAFDSVSHRFLLAKLKSSATDGAVPNWIKSYLSNRLYQVQIDGVLSEEAPC